MVDWYQAGTAAHPPIAGTLRNRSDGPLSASATNLIRGGSAAPGSKTVPFRAGVIRQDFTLRYALDGRALIHFAM